MWVLSAGCGEKSNPGDGGGIDWMYLQTELDLRAGPL